MIFLSFLLAFILTRAKISPLGLWSWFFLLIGFTQLPAPSLLIIIGWFSALNFRPRLFQQLGPALSNFMQLGYVLLTFIFLGVIYAGIHSNLLGDIHVQIEGARSTEDMLRWYVDRIDEITPTPYMISAPTYVWRGIMLLWSLWLANGLIHWLQWGWRQLTHGGGWRPLFDQK